MSVDVVLEATNTTFIEEGVQHAFSAKIQWLKSSDVVFNDTKLFKLGQTTQMMSVYVKTFISICNKFCPSNITSVGNFTSLLAFEI